MLVPWLHIREGMQDPKQLITEAQMIEANLAIVREQAKELEQQIAELESRVQIARGTGDVTTEAAAVVAQLATPSPAVVAPKPVKQPRLDLRSSVVVALKRESLTLPQLSKAVGSQTGPVAEVMKALRKENAVFNVGSAEYPIWTYRVGDKTTTTELIKQVRRLISERPMSTKELVLATDARMSRVGGCIVHLQRTEKNLVNMGSPRRARWFLLSEHVTPSRLDPKPQNNNRS